MPDEVEDLNDDEMPIPFGIDAETGRPLPGLTPADLQAIDRDSAAVQNRGQPGGEEFLAIADVDPNDLSQAGWCVLFPRDIDKAVRTALDPLIEHRKKQAGGLFKSFEGLAGYQAGMQVRKWVEMHGAGLGVVDPEQGVPLYVMIVGSPDQVPFEFQYLLDTYWCVGRVCFETPDEYRRYAENIVRYETSAAPAHRKRAAIFSVKNDGDRATGLLHKHVAAPLVEGRGTMKPVGQKQNFSLQSLLAEDATKANLSALLRGEMDGGPPALLFTGSHGVAFNAADPDRMKKQGALLCQDWPGFGPPAPEQIFTAGDVPADSKIDGMIHFLFACYGGGCPQFDNFGKDKPQPAKEILERSIVARLPQQLLLSGAQAVLAHVDRAWAYSFLNSRSASQVQEFRDVMVRILQGQRIGQALDSFNLRWAVLGVELQEQMELRDIPGQVSDAALANRWVARNDARNYIVLGDPAVRLRVEQMAV